MPNIRSNLSPKCARGYIYDAETGFYYLQSRYYDPAIGRFINADAFASTGQGILGNNMFAYCNNNPVNCSDPSGSIAIVDDIVILGIAGLCIVFIPLIIMPPPIMLDIPFEKLGYLSDEISINLFSSPNILSARTKGKERIIDTGLAGLSDEEVSQRAHDKRLPSSERQRYKKEEKARGIRNGQKRKSHYFASLKYEDLTYVS